MVVKIEKDSTPEDVKRIMEQYKKERAKRKDAMQDNLSKVFGLEPDYEPDLKDVHVKKGNLAEFFGAWKKHDLDPLEFQKQCRDEWD